LTNVDVEVVDGLLEEVLVINILLEVTGVAD